MISSMLNCTRLQVLDVAENLLYGSLPHSIANLSSGLGYLVLSDNQINGVIPLVIQNLLDLTNLDISNNDFSGPIPSIMGRLTKLQQLLLGGNRFLNELAISLGNLTLLNTLSMMQNNLSGIIRQSLSNCTNLLSLDLSHNHLSGPIPGRVLGLNSLSISLNLAQNSLTGSISSDFSLSENLMELDLSNNRLSGTIPNSLCHGIGLQLLYMQGNSFGGDIPQGLSDLKGLKELDLSHNNFSGVIPSFLGQLLLEKLNLSFNKLQGEVPAAGVFPNRSVISLEGNDALCGGIGSLKLPPCPSKILKKKSYLTPRIKILIPVVVGGILIFSLLSAFLSIRTNRRRAKEASVLPSIEENVLRLSYGDLLKATDGFSKAFLVGAGRFGSVYKGIILNDGQTLVAVKVLNLHVRGGSKTLISECNALRGNWHRNLIKIISICVSTDFQALVYEFKANGSLEKWLHQNTDQNGEDDNMRSLSLLQRLNIAIDIASAIEYLHYSTHSTIVHGDLKSSNILLDEDMTAVVGDFGLAKIISNISRNSAHTSSSAAIKGTIGYIPPEYGMSDVVTTQGDAYSYGILLLEIFTNRRPTSGDLEDHANLHLCSMEIVDPSLHRQFNTDDERNKNCMISVPSVGVACSKELPRDRMSMNENVK